MLIFARLFGLYSFSHQSCTSSTLHLRKEIYPRKSFTNLYELYYSLSAGLYFDIKIDYVDITEEEFNKRMAGYKAELTARFEESHRLKVSTSPVILKNRAEC